MKKATEVIHGQKILGDRSTRVLSVPTNFLKFIIAINNT
jgi:hypothetical protein